MIPHNSNPKLIRKPHFKIALAVLFSLIFCAIAKAQSDQQKAQNIATAYLDKTPSNKKYNYNFSNFKILKSSYDDSKIYQHLKYQVDSLTTEGKKIDARLNKYSSVAEQKKAKIESAILSKQMVKTSDQLLEYMTHYQGKPIGFRIAATRQNKTNHRDIGIKKIFYLNQQLTKVDSIN